LVLKRLPKGQRVELFKTIRWGFLKHKELLLMRQNEIFENAKNLIVEGLSVRLDPHENAQKDDLQINMHPRTSYDPNSVVDSAEKKKPIQKASKTLIGHKNFTPGMEIVKPQEDQLRKQVEAIQNSQQQPSLPLPVVQNVQTAGNQVQTQVNPGHVG
jgi:hypothetical protein